MPRFVLSSIHFDLGLVVAAVVLLSMLATQTLKADTILINDLPGLFTVSVTDPVREQASGGIGFASVAINNPDGATLIAGQGSFEWLVMEPAGTGCRFCASDFITGDESDLPSGDTIEEIFFSVRDESFFTDCSSEPCIQKNGDVQAFAGLEWSDGTIDTIEFKSTEPVPEPSTLLLVCTGMLGVGVAGSRKCLFQRPYSRSVPSAAAWIIVGKCGLRWLGPRPCRPRLRRPTSSTFSETTGQGI